MGREGSGLERRLGRVMGCETGVIRCGGLRGLVEKLDIGGGAYLGQSRALGWKNLLGGYGDNPS